MTPPTNGKKIKFHGSEKYTGEEISLYGSSSGAGNTQPYKLTVFKDGSGNGKLTTDNVEINKKYGTDLWCYPTSFKVTSDTSDSSNNSPKTFESISLTLESCAPRGEGKKQECSIKIEGSSGFSWRDDFKPKVII